MGPLLLLLMSIATLSADQSTSQVPPADPDEKLRKRWELTFRAADTDQSRSLDRVEAKTGLPKVLFRRFDKIDTDADGLITPEELWAMHEREVAARKRRRGQP